MIDSEVLKLKELGFKKALAVHFHGGLINRVYTTSFTTPEGYEDSVLGFEDETNTSFRFQAWVWEWDDVIKALLYSVQTKVPDDPKIDFLVKTGRDKFHALWVLERENGCDVLGDWGEKSTLDDCVFLSHHGPYTVFCNFSCEAKRG